jgi:type I restriction enzyme S subunit
VTWQQAKLKYVTRLMYGEPTPRIDETQGGSVQEGSVKVFGSNGAFATCNQANTKAPAIIVGRKGSYGKINWSQESCFASDTTFFVDETTTKQHLSWLFYLLQTLNLDQGTDEAAVPGLNRDDAYDKEVLVPPLSEQLAIANYLDHETAKIDTLISAKERLLDLLEEKRLSLITQALTRGVNPFAVKDDKLIEDKFVKLEAPWQPAYTNSWRFTQIKHHYEIKLGKMLQNSAQSSEDVEVPYLKAQHIQWDKVLTEELPTMWASPWEIEMLRVRKGDLLVCEGGEVGRAVIVTDELPRDCIIQNALHLVRPRQTGDLRFLKYLLLHATSHEWLDVICNKATIAHFTVEKFSQVWIWLPRLSEQRVIANYLDHETAKIDKLIVVAKKTIKLLQERRTALITAAVTGQIKVTA